MMMLNLMLFLIQSKNWTLTAGVLKLEFCPATNTRLCRISWLKIDGLLM